VSSAGGVSGSDRSGSKRWERRCSGEGDRFRIENITGSWVEHPMANTALERTIGRSWC
jgi:hypothetical protein